MIQGYNAFVMRPVTAMALCGALQVGALCAPLVHVHLDDHRGGHHDAPAVHAHVSGHSHGPADAGHAARVVASSVSRTADEYTIASQGDSEQTTRLQIFVAVEAAAFTAPALPPARFTLAAPMESVMRQAPDVVRSHGPPPRRATAPRAPPIPSV